MPVQVRLGMDFILFPEEGEEDEEEFGESLYEQECPSSQSRTSRGRRKEGGDSYGYETEQRMGLQRERTPDLEEVRWGMFPS